MPGPVTRSSLDSSIRVFGVAVLLWSAAVFLIFLFPGARGIEFRTHILLALAFVLQVALGLILLAWTRLTPCHPKDAPRLSRFAVNVARTAALLIVGQYFILQFISVDGSSVP